MDLALNNLQRLIRHKIQPTNLLLATVVVVSILRVTASLETKNAINVVE